MATEQPPLGTKNPQTPEQAQEKEAVKQKQIERANCAMQIQQALYDNALANNTFGHYINSVLFMTALVMATAGKEEAAKMMEYITTKAAEIKAVETSPPNKETQDG